MKFAKIFSAMTLILTSLSAGADGGPKTRAKVSASETIQTFFDSSQLGLEEMTESMSNFIAFTHAARVCLETKKDSEGKTEYQNQSPLYVINSDGCNVVRASNKIAMLEFYARYNRIRNIETASRIFELEIIPAADELVARNDQRQILRMMYRQLEKPMMIEQRASVKGAIVPKAKVKEAFPKKMVEQEIIYHKFNAPSEIHGEYIFQREPMIDFEPGLAERIRNLLKNDGIDENTLKRDPTSLESLRRLVQKYVPKIVPN